MAATESQMPSLGTPAHAFDLPIANPQVDERPGDMRSLDDYADAEVLVVAFLCNHCPYVHHVEPALIDLARTYASRGVQVVGICANNAETHPQDAFKPMAERARQKEYPFPYLRDASQETARAYGAACTPDFFVYDAGRTLVYRGRFDETRPNQGEPTGADLRRALDAVLAGEDVPGEQFPSVGCGIKWKPGMAPA